MPLFMGSENCEHLLYIILLVQIFNSHIMVVRKRVEKWILVRQHVFVYCVRQKFGVSVTLNLIGWCNGCVLKDDFYSKAEYW